MAELFPEIPLIRYDQDATLNALKKGDLEDLIVNQSWPVDEIAEYGLDTGLLKDILKSFPDPRKDFEVPLDALLLPQILQRLNDEHSLFLAPYMLNSSKLITKLGYNPKVLEEGFNNRNTHPRQTAFHGETLKHVLLQVKADQMESWYNTKVNQYLKSQVAGRTHVYVMDGTKLTIPAHLHGKYPHSGMVKDHEGRIHYGYKVVWICELLDRKRIFRAVKFAPINRSDLEVGKELLKSFDFEEEATLLIDRGFFDGEWISQLHKDKKIHICMPLKKNYELSQYALARLEHEKQHWRAHPRREGQLIAPLKDEDMLWDCCPVFQSGVAVQWTTKQGEKEFCVFVHTRPGVRPEELLRIYDHRAEIEEDHRQMKCFQGLEKLPSKKYTQVIFRVIMGLVGYNLFNLFLNFQDCENMEEYTLKTLRQKRKLDKNPEMIVYTQTTFAVLRVTELLLLILDLPKNIQQRLRPLVASLKSG